MGGGEAGESSPKRQQQSDAGGSTVARQLDFTGGGGGGGGGGERESVALPEHPQQQAVSQAATARPSQGVVLPVAPLQASHPAVRLVRSWFLGDFPSARPPAFLLLFFPPL